MKKRTLILTFISAALISAGASAFTIAGAVSTYNSQTDPLVTKSYVDSYVNEKIMNISETTEDAIKKEIKNQLDKTDIAKEVSDNIKDDLKSELYDEIKEDVLEEMKDEKLEGDISYKLVALSRGQRLIGVGCTELILRDGSATAITVDDGLSDVTKGVDLTSGEEIVKNHYLLIPIDDGRGILVTSNEAHVLVRGDYEIR